ncbi:MAG: DUF721 domain-containing protein [Desulfovibrionaceae bacterium]|nr:DUF721 domain-containing protein [Desulfovibrionaceae bacterium]
MEVQSYLHYALQKSKNTNLLDELDISRKLFPLWKQWDSIVGEPIISYIYPIGTKQKHLIVGTHDSSSFQEMHYYKPMLLESVNSFLEHEYFTDVIIEYTTSAHSLVQEANTIHTYSIGEPRVPKHQHVTQTLLPSTSYVARAYSAFLALSS